MSAWKAPDKQHVIILTSPKKKGSYAERAGKGALPEADPQLGKLGFFHFTGNSALCFQLANSHLCVAEPRKWLPTSPLMLPLVADFCRGDKMIS